MSEQQEQKETRCGFIALIGAPNAGKSTFINAAVGTKVAIVTHKVQTTRAQLRAVAMHGQSQLVFVDTPGIFEPRRKLDEAMVFAAWEGAGDADIVALLVDARKGITPDVERIVAGLVDQKRAAVLILNKTDVVKSERLLTLSEELNSRHAFTETFMISAQENDGVADVLSYFADNIPAGPWHYPEDHLTDVNLRVTAAEITREKLFLRVHDEIPYASTVETESFEEKKDGSYRIQQIVYVRRDSQKKIVLGKDGQTIKAIGSESRKELQEIFDTKVHLFLFVKVRDRWIEDPERFLQMGLEMPKSTKKK